MPTLTIDGRNITVEPGTRLIEAVRRLGIDIPYYCYHPGLSIAGNCRICMVEIEKFPKPQIACYTECQEGMVVRTDTEKAKEARRHILEFLLVNHPLDCPVCDQAGECWLQDYYMRFGLYDPRFYEQKVKKPKAVPLGPTVMLDAERCILCSRCVRFCDEITKTSELGIVGRGDRAEITIDPSKELKNKYSGNVVDICPVGALTDRDFRFKCRVWYLKKADSICPGCSRGCNIEIHYNLDRPQHGGGERVMRLKPRENPEVNQWWICDAGRYGYKFIDHNRISHPIFRENGCVREMSWDGVLGEIAARLQKAGERTVVLLSPQLSNEALFLAKKLFKEILRGVQVFLLSPQPDGDQDDFLIRSDKNPNSRGAELLGFFYEAGGVSEFFKEAARGRWEGAIIFGQELLGLKGLVWSVFIGPNQNLTSASATFVLPAATYAEENGTFTNFEGRVQKFNKAFDPQGGSRPVWAILQDLACRLGASWSYTTEEEIFNEMASIISSLNGLSYSRLGSQGIKVSCR